MANIKKSLSGTAIYNPNKPLRNNPYISVPADIDHDPFRLVWIDICSICKYIQLLPLIVWPLANLTPLDELYPTATNMKDVFLQLILVISQSFLLLTLPVVATLTWFLPNIINILYYSAFFILTAFVYRLLNGSFKTECLVGLPKDVEPVNDDRELWFFINGICTGSLPNHFLQGSQTDIMNREHWLQSNLSLLAQTFQREIVGIHNPTKGLLLDLIECLIQRDLNYQTSDIRQGRSQLRSALTSQTTQKVVLILHSQGGIEGSMILDWLYTDVSPCDLSKLEVYTFGNAARHFNNPFVITPIDGERDGTRAVRHIEHYANSEDFVARIGVSGFTSGNARAYEEGSAFLGDVFTRVGTGHLLNMHYLDTMFRLVNGKVPDEGNMFMNSVVPGRGRVRDISRLWKYRNGGSPRDEVRLKLELVEGDKHVMEVKAGPNEKLKGQEK